MPASLQGRIALVTGASRGIGRAVAIELAKAGAHIIALARTQGGLEDLDDAIRADGGEATLMPCDIKDFDALDRLGAVILQRWGKLDILVGNAGSLGPVTPLGHVEPRQWDETFAVNVTANWRLIRSLDPLLRASDAGRAVFITSGTAHEAVFKPYWGPIRGLEGRSRRAGAHLCGRNEEYHGGARHVGQSRSDAHEIAGAGNAQRGSLDTENARGCRSENRRHLHARMDGDGKAL